MATTLGCGSYEVNVRTRGGGHLVGPLPWSSLSWGRKLDDTSDASVTAVIGLECCELLQAVRPWRNEIQILRDGDEVWVGPLVVLRSDPEAPKLSARDLTAWWDHRLIHQDHAYTQTDLATVFQAFAVDAMAPDNSPKLNVIAHPCGVLGDYNVLASQHKKAGQLLRDLAGIAIDFTAVARDVLVGGSAITTPPIGVLVPEFFTVPPTVTLDGTNQANDWIVSGQGGGSLGDVVFGEASDLDEIGDDGLLEDVASITTIQDNAAATSAALSRVALQKEATLIERAQLVPKAPFTIAQLVPGATCRVWLEGCVPVDDYYRLQEVAVTADASGGEAVQIVLQPLGLA